MTFELEPQSVLDRLRAQQNRISARLDRTSITQRIFGAHSSGTTTSPPLTALRATESCLQSIAAYASGFELKSIAAQVCPQADGAASHWSIYGVLPEQRAAVSAEWMQRWDEDEDEDSDYYVPGPRTQVDITPYIVPDSLMDVMIKRGKLARKQVLATVGPPPGLTGPTLPVPFVDSNVVVQHAIAAGLDPTIEEFHLQSGTAEDGVPCWSLTRRHEPALVFPFA